MRLLLLAAAVSLGIATPARAADSPLPPPAKKCAVTMHYPTLEKMLRRFSREAGAASVLSQKLL